MTKDEIELFTFPFHDNDIGRLQYALEVLMERHEIDEWEAVGDKEENTEQYGQLVYLLADLLGPNVPCGQVDPLLYERYRAHCEDTKAKCDNTLTRQQILVKFRNFN